MKRITVFEITLTAAILALAITAKFFDKFIPHVHPLHIIVLIIGVTLMRFRMSTILLVSYLCLKFVLFGIKEITGFMLAMHIFELLSLLLISSIILFRKKDKKLRIMILIVIIVIAMLVYLTFMIIGDSDYAPKSVPFTERVRLALIWPGDWLNVTITTGFAIAIVPPLYLMFTELLQKKLDKRII